MGQFYNANSFVYSDAIDGRVFTGTMNAGRTAITSAQIATGLEYIVDMRPGPDGQLYGCQLYSAGFAPGRIVRWTPAGALPTVTIAVAPSSVLEDGTPNLFYTVSRTGSTAAALTVLYSVSGTATSGTDFEALSGSVVIPIAAASADVAVNPITDATVESNETVILTITPDAAYTVGASAVATSTITDDDTPIWPGTYRSFVPNYSAVVPAVHLRLDSDLLDYGPNSLATFNEEGRYSLITLPSVQGAFTAPQLFGGNAGQRNTPSGAIGVAPTALLNFGTGAFTVSFRVWVPTDFGGAYSGLVCRGALFSAGSWCIIHNPEGGGAGGVFVNLGGGGDGPIREIVGAPGTLPPNTWNLVTLTRNGSSLCTLSINNVSIGTVSCSYNLNAAADLLVGRHGAFGPATNSSNAIIKDVVVIPGAAVSAIGSPVPAAPYGFTAP
jgi:hypothetical protein